MDKRRLNIWIAEARTARSDREVKFPYTLKASYEARVPHWRVLVAVRGWMIERARRRALERKVAELVDLLGVAVEQHAILLRYHAEASFEGIPE